MPPHRGRLLPSFAFFFSATSPPQNLVMTRGLASSMKKIDEVPQINIRTVTLKLPKGSLNNLDLNLQSIIETTSKSKGAREELRLKKNLSMPESCEPQRLETVSIQHCGPKRRNGEDELPVQKRFLWMMLGPESVVLALRDPHLLERYC